MRRRLLAVTLVGGVLLTMTACGQQTSDEPQTILIQEEEEEAYPTTTVEYDDVVKNITVRCTYTSTERQELSFPIDGGLVERVEVKMGDYVNAGDLLVALDVQNLEEQIEELEYQVASQELKLKQTEEMKQYELDKAERSFSYTGGTEQDKENLKEKKEGIEKSYKTRLEDMNDTLALTKQRLQQSRDELDAGQLFAEITGEITYLENGLQGTYSVKDRIVVTVSDLDAYYFVADDLEYQEHFKNMESVVVQYRDSGKKYTCEAVPALTDSWEEQMYFKPATDEIITTEVNGTITIEVARKENVLCVPVDAIHKSDNGQFVYLEKDGLLEMRYVTVGLEGEELVEITDGLEQGEIVALKN